jgi:predicted transcriptional regulator
MKPVKVGIMPLEQYKRYTIGIARGQIKPKKSDPKIWFDTIETCMQVLSTHNLNLLKLIDEKKPESVEELARISGRQKGNLSRTLKKFERHRIVELIQNQRRKKPVARATQFDILIGREHEFNHKSVG